MNNTMDRKGDAVKYGIVITGIAGILFGVYYYTGKKAVASKEGIKEEVTTSEKPIPSPPSPSASGSGGIVFGEPIPNEVATFENPPTVAEVLSTNPIVAIQQIRDLAEQIGIIGKNDPNLSNVTPQTLVQNGVKKTVYVNSAGKVFNSEQEVLDDFIRTSFNEEVQNELKTGSGKSTIEALLSGSKINATNFITKRPVGFPAKEITTKFDQKAQALGATLTVDNPGGSSNARVPNFSRLAAVGVDLSKVDLFGVQNPRFLGQIKSGQGPLTKEQKILIDQERLRIDSRNMTSSVRAQITANQNARVVAATAVADRAKELTKAGFDEAKAKEFLKSRGFNITGSLTAVQFAALERRLTG